MRNKDIQKPLRYPVDHCPVYLWRYYRYCVLLYYPSIILRHSCDRMCLGTGELLVVATIIITLLPSASVPLLSISSGHSYTLLHYWHSRLLVVGKCPDIPWQHEFLPNSWLPSSYQVRSLKHLLLQCRSYINWQSTRVDVSHYFMLIERSACKASNQINHEKWPLVAWHVSKSIFQKWRAGSYTFWIEK